MHPKNERTYVMIKPDGVQRSLVGEIISRIEKTGLKISGMKMFVPDRERLTEHYGKDDAWCTKKGQIVVDNLTKAGKPVEKEAIEYGRGIIEGLLSFMSAGPVVAMVIEGNQAAGILRKIVGDTQPLTADVGTIRSDLTIDSYQIANLDFRAVRNLIHCSEDVEEATREISIWFRPEEIISYRHINEAILYDVNLDGILE